MLWTEKREREREGIKMILLDKDEEDEWIRIKLLFTNQINLFS